MTGVTNNTRADAAGAAMLAYAQTKEGRWDYEPPPTVLTDLLSDLMHWADASGIHFDECSTRARFIYEDEKAEEQFDRLADSVHDVFALLKRALDELRFQQKHFPRGDDTELRETIAAAEELIAVIEGGAP